MCELRAAFLTNQETMDHEETIILVQHPFHNSLQPVSIVFSSPVALDSMAAYSSKAFAEKRNRAKEVMFNTVLLVLSTINWS